MRSRRKTAAEDRILFSCIAILAASCSGPASTDPLADGSTSDGASSVTDLGGSRDLAGSAGDLGHFNCTGQETFQQARTAMLSGCSGFGQFTCHTKTPYSGGLDLNATKAYQNLVNVPASIAPTKLRVKPGDPRNSFIVQKLTNTQGPTEGNPMPDPVEGLMWQPPDPMKLLVLECWIQNGALNN